MATFSLSEELSPAPELTLPPESTIDLKARLLAYERELITAALSECRGNQRRAAHRLGILPTTLHEKMKRLGLRADPFLPAGVRDGAAHGSQPQPDSEASL